MADTLDCGHPKACVEQNDDGELVCIWCEDREQIVRQDEEIAALRRAVRGKAVIVDGGSPVIDGPIDYLVVNPGGGLQQTPTDYPMLSATRTRHESP